jgi:hypothetical protein
LGLTVPWTVSSADFDIGAHRLDMWLARVTATSRKLSSASTTMPFGLGIVSSRQVSHPSDVSR